MGHFPGIGDIQGERDIGNRMQYTSSPFADHRHRLGQPSRTTPRGQTMVEFALVVPVLLLVVFALLQFSVVLLARNAFAMAVRDGARTLAVHGTEKDANTLVCGTMISDLQNSAIMSSSYLSNLTLYRANANDPPVGSTPPPPQDTGTCVPQSGGQGKWTYGASVGYPPYKRQIVFPPDWVGVSANYTFHFWLPMFGSGVTFHENSIARLEPLFAQGSSGVTGPTPAPTFTSTPLPTNTPYPTATPYPTSTPFPTSTPTDTPTAAPTATDTPTMTPTITTTPTRTATPTPTSTATASTTLTLTPTPVATVAATATLTPTSTANTPAPTLAVTVTPAPTLAVTPTPTP